MSSCWWYLTAKSWNALNVFGNFVFWLHNSLACQQLIGSKTFCKWNKAKWQINNQINEHFMQLGFHMRYHLLLHYWWFLQNLEKGFIPTNMHTTVGALQSTCPLVFGCCKLSHVIFLILRKTKVLAKLSKFTKWQPFSLEKDNLGPFWVKIVVILWICSALQAVLSFPA